MLALKLFTIIRIKDSPGGSVVKNLPVKAGDPVDAGSMPVLRRSPGRGNSNPL